MGESGYAVEVKSIFLFETKPFMEITRALIRERKGKYSVTLVYIDGTTEKVQL